MNRCAEAAAVAASVPGAGVGNARLRPPMVPRQASFFPPPVPNPFVQQTRLGAARRLQVRSDPERGEGVTGESDSGGGSGSEGEGPSRGGDLDLKEEEEPREGRESDKRDRSKEGSLKG